MTFNPQGSRDLICAIIEQAVLDYRELRRIGVIVKGKLNRRWLVANKSKQFNGVLTLRREAIQYRTPAEVDALIEFFSQSGPLEKLLRVAGVSVAAAAIRRAL